jgi:hypothetical protein
MKLTSALLLFFFVAFLSAPTIVTLIEKNSDVSVLFNCSEEETNKDLKEIKANLNESISLEFLNWNYKINNKIIFENLSKHDNVFAVIFSPPPEFI